MTAIFFIYGLAFFILGLVILVYPKKQSIFSIAKNIWLIAGFGILHGTNEWLDMFMHIESPAVAEVLRMVRMVTLPLSFLCLLVFGAKVISATHKKFRWLQILPGILFIAWLGIFILFSPHLLLGDIWSRYLLCVPGTLLTGIALLLQIPEFEKTKQKVIVRSLVVSAVAFLIYGVLAGLIVKKADFFGADFLNYDSFKNLTGVPVQIFRAVCALVIAYSTVCLLKVFRWETREVLHRSEERCSMIASSSPLILFGQDSNSVINFIQGKGLDLIGRRSDELIGRHISEVFPSEQQLYRDSLRALKGEEFVTTFAIEDYIFEACYLPVKDSEGVITGLIGAALDITSRVKAQQELNKYKRELERNGHLMELGSMSFTMGKELEEPIAVTRLLLERLMSQLDDNAVSNDIVIGLKKSLSEVSNASKVVEKYRRVSQVSPESATQPVDLYKIVKRMMEVFAQSARQANLTISAKDIDIVPGMVISERELEQVFFAIIRNVIDNADPDRKQELVISCNASDKQTELRFSDTCGEREPEKLERIFEPFSITGQTEAGLNLAIVKEIVSFRGGEITAQSRSGLGTSLSVILPQRRTDTLVTYDI